MPLPPPPAEALMRHGVADLVREGARVLDGCRPARQTAGYRRARRASCMVCLGSGLVADAGRCTSADGPDEDKVVVDAGAGKVGVLGQEAVAGVDGLARPWSLPPPMMFGRCSDSDWEDRRGADADLSRPTSCTARVSLVCQWSRPSTDLMPSSCGGAHDAQRDLSSVGNSESCQSMDNPALWDAGFEYTGSM